MVAGGDFTQAGDATTTSIATLVPDTGEWSALGEGLIGTVYAVCATPDGRLLAAGDLLDPDSLEYRNVFEWNGARWRPFSTGEFNGTVLAMSISPQGEVAVGGDFTRIGTTNAARVARWSSDHWAPCAEGFDGVVYTLSWSRTFGLVAGGRFHSSGGRRLDHIASLSGDRWNPMGAGMDDAVWALESMRDGRIAAGGDFIQSGNRPMSHVAFWNGSAWMQPGAGCTHPIYALKQASSGVLWAAGGSSQLSEASDALEVWNGSAWSETPGYGAAVWALAESNHGTPAIGVSLAPPYAGWESSFAILEGYWWQPNGRGSISSDSPILGLSDGAGVVTGSPEYAGEVLVHNIAVWDGAQYHALGGGVNGTVRGLYQTRCGDIIAIGEFSRAGDTVAGGMARWDGARWSSMGRGIFPFSNIVGELPDGRILANGRFTNDGRTVIQPYATWNGVEWVEWTNLPPGIAYRLAQLPDGNLIATGYFTFPGSDRTYSFARFDGSSWRGEDIGLAFVDRLFIASDGAMIASGESHRADGSDGNVFWDLHTWSAVPVPLPREDTSTTPEILPLSASQLLWVYNSPQVAGLRMRVDGAWHELEPLDVGYIAYAVITPYGEILIRDEGLGFGLRAPYYLKYSPASSVARIQTQPSSAITCLTGNAEFSVLASAASPIRYQWEVDTGNAGSPVWTPISCALLALEGSTNTRVDGFASPTLRLSGVDISTGARFRCRVQTLCGETVSDVATLTVCLGDHNCDGGVDGSDIDAFIRNWTDASPSADVNQDGGVDGADIQPFFTAWESGC
jgi:hypothetical protein